MMRASSLRWAVILVLAMVMGAVAAPVAGQDSKAILLLHTYGYDAPGRFPFDTAFARAVREASNSEVDLYVETLDSSRFGGEPIARKMREYLRDKYAGKNITVVAAAYEGALAFLLDERDPLFPTVPVAALLDERPQSLPERVAVIFTGESIRESIALALRLTPNARQIAIIDTPPDGSGRDAVHSEVQDRIETLGRPVVFLHNLSLDELLAQVHAVPPDGIIVFLRHYSGPRGRPIPRADAVREVARVAQAPVYVNSDQLIGFGALGGMVVQIETEGANLATLALGLSEKRSLRVPPTQSSLVPMFDWRELRRWGIDERLLPPGSEVLFRERGLWDQYRWYVIGAVSVTLVQGGLIMGLVVQRARRRRMEMALRESEQHFRTMADTAPVLIWRSGTDQACDFFNKPWLDFRGRTLEQEEGSGWTDGVHQDDRAPSVQTYAKAFESREPFRMEYRLQRADGAYRWVLDIGVPRYDDAGRFAGYIGSAIDITERKQIEHQNQDLAGRLIGAQEEERTRIARDLHDDLGQQLAALAMMLGSLKYDVGKTGSAPDLDRTVTTLEERTSAIAVAIRNLSHELHPSVLEYVGLVATLRGHCAGIEDRHLLKVIFSAGDHLDSLDPKLALCLFRVTQEALTNAVRHARASQILVELMATNEGVELHVVDDGIGFVASERSGSGLGLRSIDERVRLARGHVSLESRPGLGTKLVVRIPQPPCT